MEDDYITLDDDDDESVFNKDWVTKAQQTFLVEIEDIFSLSLSSDELVSINLHKDLENKSEYLRVHINNSYPTCLKFKKKPTWIQRVFLKILGIKFALEG